MSETLQILRKISAIPSWGNVYLGLKKNWLTCNSVVKLAERKLISSCTEDDLVELYLSNEESIYIFLDKIKELLTKYEGYKIEHNEDQIEEDRYFKYIPNKYWLFWEVELLLRSINSEKSTTSILHSIADVHSDLNYPKSWDNFIYFSVPVNGIPLGENKLLEMVKDYIENSLVTLSYNNY